MLRVYRSTLAIQCYIEEGFHLLIWDEVAYFYFFSFPLARASWPSLIMER